MGAQNKTMANSRGKFLTIEGQDGAGKSTNIAVIESWLEQHNIAYQKTREPGGTKFGESLRELILQSDPNDFGDQAELLLMFAARAQHLAEVIEPALTNGEWVLCDRFTDATYAYQGGGRGVSFGDIAALERLVQGSLRPDLTVLLDLPVEVGESRANARSQPDRFEQEQRDFKQRVRDAYLSIAEAAPERVKVINASQSMASVETEILAVLSAFRNAL